MKFDEQFRGVSTSEIILDQDPGWTQTLVIAPDGYPAKHVENAMESHALSRKMAYNCWGKSGYSGFPNFLWQFAGSEVNTLW